VRRDTPERAPHRGHGSVDQPFAASHPVFGTPIPVTWS
jgi:hypothetical protein